MAKSCVLPTYTGVITLILLSSSLTIRIFEVYLFFLPE